MIKFKEILVLFFVLLLIGCATTKADWEKAQRANTILEYQQFLKKYPQSEFTAKAKLHLDWQEAQLFFGDLESYQKFINKYPRSEFAAEAEDRIQNLEWQRTKQLDTMEAFQEFINKYPHSKFSHEAKTIIEFKTKLSKTMNLKELRRNAGRP